MGTGEKNLKIKVLVGPHLHGDGIFETDNFQKRSKKKTCLHEGVFKNIPIYTETLEMTGNYVVPAQCSQAWCSAASLQEEEEEDHGDNKDCL